MSTKRGKLCKKGLHRMTPANTYDHPAKGPECRACKREYMRSYMRTRRASAARKSSKASAKKSAKRRRA